MCGATAVWTHRKESADLVSTTVDHAENAVAQAIGWTDVCSLTIQTERAKCRKALGFKIAKISWDIPWDLSCKSFVCWDTLGEGEGV